MMMETYEEYEAAMMRFIRVSLGIPITDEDWTHHVEVWGRCRPNGGQIRQWARRYDVFLPTGPWPVPVPIERWPATPSREEADWARRTKNYVRERFGIPISDQDWQAHLQMHGWRRPGLAELRKWAKKYDIALHYIE